MYERGRVVAATFDGKLNEMQLYGLLFAGAVAAFCLNTLIGRQLGATAPVLSIVGNMTCGCSWLLVRALFQRPTAPRQWWPLAVVAAMVVVGATLRLVGDSSVPLLRILGNAEDLTSSTLLLLATIEPLRGIGSGIPFAEKRFRISFVASYAAVLIIAVLWVDGPPADSSPTRYGGAIKAACALAALAGMGFAIWYRVGHPVPEPMRPKRRVKADDEGLGERILSAMQREAVFSQHDLKVADLARYVGEAEYKVTQCVTGALGFRNFNQMVNSYRLAEAKRRLVDPSLAHLPILTIALDCGFGSVGPFNRIFRAETGTTPKQFRKSEHADAGRAA